MANDNGLLGIFNFENIFSLLPLLLVLFLIGYGFKKFKEGDLFG